jgi:hypothetical protein
MAATRPTSTLAESSAKALKRAEADISPQEMPKVPSAPAARRSFMTTRRW